MDGVVQFWAKVTEPQAIIISGLLTIIAAVLGVLFGSILFGGRVKNIKEALDKIEQQLKSHASLVGDTLDRVKGDLEGLQVEVSKARGDIQQAADAAEANAIVAGVEQNTVVAPELPALGRLREAWEAVRVELERRSRDASIDGRTRAKYGRIDRRSYQSLIDLMTWDENLSDEDAAMFSLALQIWMQHRNGRMEVSAESLSKIELLRQSLVVGH